MRAFPTSCASSCACTAASPLFWGVALLFFVLHLLTLTQTGINLGDNDLIDHQQRLADLPDRTRAGRVRHAAGDRVRGDRDDSRP